MRELGHTIQLAANTGGVGGASVMDRTRKPSNEAFRGWGEDNSYDLLAILARSRRQVTMTSDGLKPEWFSNPDVNKMMDIRLRDGMKARVLIGQRGTESPSDGERLLIEEDHPLAKWRSEFPDQVQVYWTPQHIRREFVIVDGIDALVEHPDHDDAYPPTAIRYGDRKLGNAWEEQFDMAVKKAGTEILLGA